MVKDQRFSGYDIVDTVEETAGATFYRGKKSGTSDSVIIQSLKIESPSPVERAMFAQEYKTVSANQVDGMVHYLDRIETRDSMTLVLEDFPGLPLSRVFSKKTPDMALFLNIAATILDTLAALHRKNIIHKNISPESILLHRESGRVKLTHFGFISALTHENDTLHDPRVIRHSMAYMSPEQTGHMNRPVDYRTDLYSLGCVFYELLTGTIPFDPDNPMEMIHAHIARLPVPPDQVRPGIPSVVSDIILKLLAKNPEDRYQNGLGASADFAECRDQLKRLETISPFDLGAHDIPLQFNIPHVLVGREKEVDVLMTAFDQINKGNKELVMVGGLPGIGKSALINEIRKPVVANTGYFCSGKYDQFTRDVPYSAIIHAFKGLIHQVLAEGDTNIAMWRKKLNAALGPNGKVLTDVIPALEFIIGPQPDVPVLEPEESKNRFNYVFQNFINVFACREHSLVLFLDDMQWADVAGTELIKGLITHHNTRYFLLICAYRNNETGPAHPFMLTVGDMKKARIPVKDLSLGPISPDQANRLVAIALRSNPDQTEPLSALIHQKTAGNPFFVIQFCKSLYDLGYLEVEPGKGLSWDLSRISRMQVTDNVVELMADRISSLGEKTRDTLMLSAAIGNEFNPEILAIVSGLPLEDILGNLTEAIRMNLIGINKKTYLFLHDRIQEAAYSLIPDEKRARLHLTIGKNMLEKTPAKDLPDHLFHITDHLNQGRSLIHDPDEKMQLAELNLSAGEKARQSTAFRSAIAYLDHALSLLPTNFWDSHYAMSLSIHMKKLECQSLSLDLDAALETFESIEQNVRGNVDIANAYNLITYLYTIHVDFEKALHYGLKGMALVGVNIPKKPSDLRILWQLIKLRITFGVLQIEAIKDLPYCNDPEHIAFTHLAVSTTTVAFYVDANLFTYIIITGAEYIPLHGNFEITPFALDAIGSVLGSLYLFKHGFRFGETSLKMLDNPIHVHQRGRVLYLFSYFILHTRRHGKECIDNFNTSFVMCLECGDLIYSLHNISMKALYRIILGDNLGEVLTEYSQYDMFLKESRDPFAWQMYRDTAHFIRCLQGETPVRGRMDEDDFSEDKALSYYRSENNLIGVFLFRLSQLKVRYLFGEFRECLGYFRELGQLLKSKIAIGTMFIPEFVMYHSLVIAAVYPDASPSKKIAYRSMLAVNHFKMKLWARSCPDNYEHKYLLIRAERCRLKRKRIQAIKFYRQAIESAVKYGFTQNKALIKERLGNFLLEIDAGDMASTYLTEACRDYLTAGFPAKAELLKETYSDLVKGVDITRDGNVKNAYDRIDLETIMQVSRAIAGEVVLDKLLTLIMDTTMKRAGAVRGFLFLEHDGKWVVEAQGDMSRQEAFGVQSIPMESHGGFAQSVVHYVAHTQKTLLLDNAASQGDFTLDPYILDHQPRSILCLPILNQGRLSAIIYFENTLTANAFKPEHMDFLGLLSSQAAVAIDNARLYENLEEKVKLRTEELNQTLQTVENVNNQIMGSLRYASMIQKSLLPGDNVFKSNLADSFVIWIPRDIVGGDIYHVEIVDNHMIVAVIDCTGHGVPGAFMTMIASSGLRRIIKEDKVYNPALILRKLNAFVKTTLQQDKENAHADDGMDVSICCYSFLSDTLLFAGARLCLYMVKDDEVQVIKGDKKSLGYITSTLDHDFTLHTLEAVKGTRFYLPTDGYMDQLGEAPAKRFGNKHFRSLITDHHTKPFADQKDILLNALNLHKGSEDQTDDITIVGFQL